MNQPSHEFGIIDGEMWCGDSAWDETTNCPAEPPHYAGQHPDRGEYLPTDEVKRLEPVRKWAHRQGDIYVPAIGRIVGNPANWEMLWTVLEESDKLGDAISEGFTECGTDDFNIVAIRKGGPAALLWMNEIVDDQVPKELHGLLKRR
jgi:hypothetical protein